MFFVCLSNPTKILVRTFASLEEFEKLRYIIHPLLTHEEGLPTVPKNRRVHVRIITTINNITKIVNAFKPVSESCSVNVQLSLPSCRSDITFIYVACGTPARVITSIRFFIPSSKHLCEHIKWTIRLSGLTYGYASSPQYRSTNNSLFYHAWPSSVL
jgi:hypothetical protein